MTITPPVILGAGFAIGLAVALSFWISPVIAIPLLVLGIGVIGLLDLQRRRRHARELHEFRDEAKTEKVEFTERDQQTLTSE
jgi:hypothetical protein